MSTEYDNLVNRAEIAATNAAASSKAAQEALAEAQQIATVINEQQATSINNSKEAIRQAIVAKGQDCDTSVAFDQYAGKINAIDTGVDTSRDTVTADKMLDGITAHDATGNQITGNIVSRSLPNLSLAVDADSGRITATYTAETGYYKAGTVDAAETMDTQSAKTYTPSTQDQTIPAYKFLTGTQTIKGEPNLIAENIPSDMNFFGIQGTREIGTTGGGSCKFYERASVDAGGTWTGYEWLRKEETKTEIDTTVEVTSFTVSGSGVSGLDSTFTKSSDTYYDEPVYTNTSNMYCWCYSDKWCITAKTGNLSTVYAHSAETSPENPWDATTWYGTWLNENQLTNMVVTANFQTKEVTTIVYEKSTTITEGLSWTSVKPVVGKSYTEDALVEVKLYEGTNVPDDFIYHWTMGSSSEFSEASIDGSVIFGTENDRPLAKFHGNSQINYSQLSELPQGNSPHSIALWIKTTTPCTDDSAACLVGWGSTPYGATVTTLSWGTDGTSAFTNWGDVWLTSPVLTDGAWHHLVGTFDGTTARLYLDGEQTKTAEGTFAIGGTQFAIGGCFWTDCNHFTGALSAVYIYSRAISDREVLSLYNEFTVETSGGGKFYECTEVGDGTWSGCEWVLTDGVYSKSAVVTPGLVWTSVKPIVGKSYSADALIQAFLYQGVSAPTDYLIYYPMTSADEFSGSVGQGISFIEDAFGRGYASFAGTGKINTSVDLPNAGNPFSIVVSLRPTADIFQGIIGFGADFNNHNTLYISGGYLRWGDWVNDAVDADVPVVFDEFNTYVLVFDGTDYTFYGADGVSSSAGIPSSFNSYSNYTMSIGGAPGFTDNLYKGDMRDLYIFDRALTREEVQALIG